MATALSYETWEGYRFKGHLLDPETRGYDQFGALKGELFIGGVGVDDKLNERMELNLPGIKVRRWGATTVQQLDVIEVLIGVCKDGMVFHVGAFHSKENKTLYGFFFRIFKLRQCAENI